VSGYALRERAGWQETAGQLVDVDGAVVGQQRGAAAYTVGQRTGLGVALGERRYVGSIDAGANLVTLARREDLQKRDFAVDGVSFVAGGPPEHTAFEAEVRIRHRAEPVPGVVTRADDLQPDRGGRWTVALERPAWAPAPGQAAVFYRGDEVIGGGRIA
jgi:tRNA-specific 2-thiouridylase